MSEQNIEFVSEPYRPSPLPASTRKAKREYTEDPKKARGYASVAFFTLVAINIAAFTLDFIPEVTSLPSVRTAFAQVDPLTTQLASGGSGTLAFRPTVIAALIFSGALWATAYSRLRFSRFTVCLLTASTSALTLYLTFPGLPFQWMESSIPLVLGFIIAGYTIAAAVKLPRTAAAPRSADRRGSTWMALCLIIFIVPIAIGRAISIASITLLGSPAGFGNLEPDVTATFLYLVGASAIVAVWGILQLLPPWPVSQPVWPTVIILAGVIGMVAGVHLVEENLP